jgi:hypothetical protein
MIENRTTPRLRSLLKGKIIYNNRLSTVDCVVRDISGTGARLALSHHTTLPDRFELYVPLKEKTYAAAVRWRGDEDFGVMFVDGSSAMAERSSDTALLHRVERLEAQVRDLQALAKSLVERGSIH